MEYKEQIGNYVMQLPNVHALWEVRMAGATEILSQHNTEIEAYAAIKRYQEGDKRRQRAS